MPETKISESEIKYGDVFILGDRQHRIACGRSDDPEIIKKLVGSEKIRAVICDPPYGVAYVEGKKDFHIKGGRWKEKNLHKEIIGDELQTEENYAEFTKKWIEAIKPYLAPKNSFYIFNSDWMICALRKGMKDAGLYYSQLIIWVKNATVLGRKDYNPQHELIAYGWSGSHKFERSKDKSVIFCPKPSKNKLHPTMKPVSLIRKLILNSTKAKECIFDGYLGSGTAILAAEETGRRTFGVELDPHYIFVCIQRFERIFGQKVTKDGN